MEYLSTQDMAKRWGVSLRQVQRLLAHGRIPGAQKYGRAWMIPANATKPVDSCKDNKYTQTAFSSDLSQLIAATAVPMPSANPDEIINMLKDRRLQLQYEGELAYLRGDFGTAIRCFYATEGDDAARLRSSLIAIAAAISLGDYHVYKDIEIYLKDCVKDNQGSVVAIFAELALATAAVSVIAPNMAPDWLKDGDFLGLVPEARPDALYLRAKYFHCLAQDELSLAVAQSALTLTIFLN